MKYLHIPALLIALLYQSAAAGPALESFQACADGFSSQDCHHINEAGSRFLAIEHEQETQNQRLEELEAQNNSAGTFDLIVVDQETREQVGIYAGEYVFKTVTPDGNELVEFGYPQPLPVVDTNVTVTNLWLEDVTATYDCDGQLLGWWSVWRTADRPRIFRAPRQSFQRRNSNWFGSLQNGDVVRARVTTEDSVVWSADYSGIVGLDEDAVDTTSNPNYVEFRLNCFIEVESELGGPDSPFNMTWATTLPDIANISRHSGISDGPSPIQPHIYFSNDLVGGNPNPGNPLFDALMQRCLELAGQTHLGWTCINLNFPDPEMTRWIFQSPVLKVATYTTTHELLSVEPIADVPGNRGAHRAFELEWRK